MFKFVSSLIGSVMGQKRSLEDEQHEDIVEKKQKVEQTMVHRIKVSNLPERDLPMVKKYFKGLGFNRFKKAPNWSYGFITVEVNISCMHT